MGCICQTELSRTISLFGKKNETHRSVLKNIGKVSKWMEQKLLERTIKFRSSKSGMHYQEWVLNHLEIIKSFFQLLTWPPPSTLNLPPISRPPTPLREVRFRLKEIVFYNLFIYLFNIIGILLSWTKSQDMPIPICHSIIFSQNFVQVYFFSIGDARLLIYNTTIFVRKKVS